jgi:hypothetical protein
MVTVLSAFYETGILAIFFCNSSINSALFLLKTIALDRQMKL